jgi:hypothetical protein
MNSKAGKDFVNRNTINSFASQGDKDTPDEVSRYIGENELDYKGPDMTGKLQQMDGHRYSINVNFEAGDLDSRSSGLARRQSIEEEEATKPRRSLGLNQSGTLLHVAPVSMSSLGLKESYPKSHISP